MRRSARADSRRSRSGGIPVARQEAATDWEESQGLGVRLVEGQIAISDWRANKGIVRRLNGGRNAPQSICGWHEASGPRPASAT